MNTLLPLHVGISVFDMGRSVEWYTRILHFHLLSRAQNAALDAELCFLEREGFQLELFRYKKPKPLPADRLHPNTDLQTIGTKHIAFQVENLSQWMAQFEAEQVDIVFHSIIKGKPMCFIRDPDGVLIELIEYRAPQELDK